MQRLDRRTFVSRAGASLLLAGLGGNVLAACEGGDGGGGGGGDTLTVGLLAPLSGVFADFGNAMRNSATIAVQRVNRDGGILGRPVAFKLEDTKSDPGIGSQRARRLLSENLEVVIGTVSSAVTLAVLPLINQADKTFIYPVDGDDRACVAGGGTNPRVFGLGDTPVQRQSRFVPYAVRQFGKKWYLLGNDYVFPRSELAVTKKLLAQAGGVVVAEDYPPLGTDDYAPIVRKIRSSAANVVFAVVSGTDGVAFVKEARESGLFDKLTITGVATFAPEIYPGMAPYAEGVVTVDRYTEQIDNPTNRAFLSAYKAKYNPRFPLGGAAACTYGAFLMLQQAARKAGTLDKGPLRDALAGLRLELPLGPVEMDPQNHILKQHEYVLKIRNGRYEIVKDLGLVAQPDHEGCTVS
jgi:ABC-type branched-subunit amino acid transport system substrate-binding protein